MLNFGLARDPPGTARWASWRICALQGPVEGACAIGRTLSCGDRAYLTPERLGVLAHGDSSGRLSNALWADTVIFGVSALAHLQRFLLSPHRYGCKLRPIGLQ